MELLVLALPFATTAVMFAFKKLASLEMFYNGAEAAPWLRVLLIVTSLIGVTSFALLNGSPLDPDSITGLLKTLIGTGANAYLSHAFYKTVRPTN